MSKSEDDLSPRAMLGLNAASAGSIHGVRKFVGFVDQEMRALGIVAFHPEVAARLSSFARETDRLASFLDGFLVDRSS